MVASYVFQIARARQYTYSQTERVQTCVNSAMCCTIRVVASCIVLLTLTTSTRSWILRMRTKSSASMRAKLGTIINSLTCAHLRAPTKTISWQRHIVILPRTTRENGKDSPRLSATNIVPMTPLFMKTITHVWMPARLNPSHIIMFACPNVRRALTF